LTRALINDLGSDNVIAADLVDSDPTINCRYEKLDIVDAKKYESIVKENKVDYIVHLAAILSASGEKMPDLAYDVNVTGAQNAFMLSREYKTQLFIPSSIAAFGGDNFQKDMTPNDTILQPKTIYGVTKVFNELLGQYYHDKYGVDFRSIRYPGVISSAKYAFNGTTDYSTGKLC
jgi:nucleoside-diphosphate-sugar epimerase